MAKPDQDLRTKLWQGLRTNHIELVRQALGEGADPNCAYGSWRPLGKALRHDMPEIALLLVEAGADLGHREYEHNMMTVAAGSVQYLEVLRAMLARVPGDFDALEAAARSGNRQGVELLLEAGAPPLPPTPADKDVPRRWPWKEPVLGYWPWKRTTPPAALVEATYAQPLSDLAAQQLGLSFADHRNFAGLQQLVERAHLSARARQQILYQCLQACWMEASQWLIEHRYAPGGVYAGPGTGMLTAMASWLSDPKRRTQGWQILTALVEQGHHPDLRLLGSELDDEAGDPQGVVLLGRVAAPVRRKLLKQLLALGMSPFYPGDVATSSLAHALVALDEFDLLPVLDQHFPGRAWETPETHSLIHTWIAHHGLVRDGLDTEKGQAMLKGLAWCEGTHGVDWTRVDDMGRSLLREFLEANQMGSILYENKQSALLETIALRFIEHGVDALAPDSDGVSDIQFAQQIELAEPIVARLMTAAMERQTADATPAKRGPRL